MKTVGNFWLTFFFIYIYIISTVCWYTYYKRTQKVKKFKMSLVLLGFLLKVERVSGCELLLQQAFQKSHPSSEASEEKKKCSSQFFLLNRIHPTWTKFNFLLLLFYAFSRYICIIREREREKTDSVLDSVSNPIPHGWNEKKRKEKYLR
jgi:hypothetical protein